MEISNHFLLNVVITSKQVLFYFYRKSQREKLEVHTSEPSKEMLLEAVVLFSKGHWESFLKAVQWKVKSQLPVNMPTPLSSVYHSSHWELKSISSSLESRLCMSNRSDNSHVRFLSSGPLAITFHLGTQLSHGESTLFLPEMVDAWKDRPWRRGDPSREEST